MRGLGLIGLLLALLIVGLVAKKQMTSTVVPSMPGVAAAPAGEPAGNVREQSQRVQQQVKDALEAASKPREMPDDN